MTKELDGQINFRCNTALLKSFKDWCDNQKDSPGGKIDHQEYMRAVLKAGPDNRLKMGETESHPLTLELDALYSVKAKKTEVVAFQKWAKSNFRVAGNYLRQVIEASVAGKFEILKEGE